jgi:hypothetical protein
MSGEHQPASSPLQRGSPPACLLAPGRARRSALNTPLTHLLALVEGQGGLAEDGMPFAEEDAL